MLQNAYFLAKIGTNTAENERNFAEKLPKIGNYPTRTADPDPAAPSGILDDLGADLKVCLRWH